MSVQRTYEQAGLLITGHPDINQRMIADELGVSSPFISNQVSGRVRMQQRTLEAIARLTNDYQLVAAIDEAARASYARKHNQAVSA